MDTISIIIILIILGLCVYLMFKSKQNVGRQIRRLSELANKQGFNITNAEFCSNVTIGLDEANNYLFFIKELKNEMIEKTIDLKQIKDCRLLFKRRNALYNKHQAEIIDRLEICLNYTDSIVPAAYLEIYNTDYDNLTLNGELELGQKWVQLISNQLIK